MEAWCNLCTLDLLARIIETNCSLRANIREIRTKYDQELLIFAISATVQPLMVNYYSRKEVSGRSSRVACKHLGAYKSEPVSSNFRLESDLSFGIRERLIGTHDL